MSKAYGNPDCHELRVFATNGRAFHISVAGAQAIVFSLTYFWTMVLFSTMVALFNAPMFGVSLSAVPRFLYWLFDCLFVTALWLLQFRFHAWLSWRTGREIPVFSAVMCTVGVGGAVWVNYWAGRVLFEAPQLAMSEVWLEILRYVLIALVFDLVTVSFILPRFEHIRFADQHEPAPRPVVEATPVVGAVDSPAVAGPSQPPAAQLQIKGKSLPVVGLRYLKSVEHYVEFAYGDRTPVERASLRDLIAQLDGADGIQPHRSYWVHRNAVQAMERRNGNPVMVLTCGAEVPVARTRRVAVSDWIAQGSPTGG